MGRINANPEFYEIHNISEEIAEDTSVIIGGNESFKSRAFEPKILQAGAVFRSSAFATCLVSNSSIV